MEFAIVNDNWDIAPKNIAIPWQNVPAMIRIKPPGGLKIDNENEVMVESFHLLRNYPNPVNSITTIEIVLPRSAFLKLQVYNIIGEEVATLISIKTPAGKYKYVWPARWAGADANNLLSGVYFYRLEEVGEPAIGLTQTRKLVLLKQS
ncbi:MAG: hypothetical protein Kow0042_15280 [Calditrichia bacterium]